MWPFNIQAVQAVHTRVSSTPLLFRFGTRQVENRPFSFSPVKELHLDGMSLVRQVSHNFCFELFTYGLATIEQFTMLWKQRGTRWPLSAAQQEVEIVNRSFGPLAAVETVTVEDVSTADKPVVSWSAVTGATAYKITLYQ